MPPSTEAALRQQARTFGRYLLLEEPVDSVVDAYVQGCADLFGEENALVEDPLVDLASRRPALLPLLDGAVAWRGADELLRRKILLMLAVAEASPGHLDAFGGDPSPHSPRAVALELVAGGAKAVLGLALLRAIGR